MALPRMPVNVVSVTRSVAPAILTVALRSDPHVWRDVNDLEMLLSDRTGPDRRQAGLTSPTKAMSVVPVPVTFPHVQHRPSPESRPSRRRSERQSPPPDTRTDIWTACWGQPLTSSNRVSSAPATRADEGPIAAVGAFVVPWLQFWLRLPGFRDARTWLQ